MPHTRHLLGLLLVVVAVLHRAGPAVAQDADAGGVVGFIVDEQSKTLEIAVHPKVATIIHFDSPVLQYAKSRYAGLIVRQNLGGSIVVRPNRNAREFGNLQVMTRLYDVSLRFRVVARPEQAAQAVEITRRDRAAEEIAKLQRGHEQHMRALQAAFVKSLLALQQDADEQAKLAPVKRLWGQEFYPVLDQQATSPDGVTVRLGRGIWDGLDYYPAFEIHNGGKRPVQFADVHASSGLHVFQDAEALIDSPGLRDDGIFAELQPGETVRGAVRLPNAAEHGFEPLRLAFHQPNGLGSVVAAVQTWVMRPMTEEELAGDEWAKAERGRVSLHLQAIGGAAWLGDGLGLDRSDATFIKGLGGRVTYGFNRYVAVEGEVMGASTGAAQFRAVTLDGMQGDLERSAALGRAQFGGLLRLGRRYVPVLRLGLGLQGANHSSRLMTDTGEVSRPSSFEWNRLFNFGAGIDVRLGPFQAGIALSAVSPWGDYKLFRSSIEAGIHLGYSWKQ